MPIKSGTLNHIQSAYQEAISAAIQGFIGQAYNPAAAYILNGCINTGSGGNYAISAGAVFYNGEVLLVPAASFAVSGSNVAVGVINTAFDTNPADNADPVAFTDGSSYNVHQIRTVVFQPGLSGSGAFDFSALQNPALNITSSNTGLLTISGTYPNIVLNPVPQNQYFPIFYQGTIHVGDVENTPSVTDTGLTWLSGSSSSNFNGYLYTFPGGYETADLNYLVLVTVRNDSYIDGNGLVLNNGVSIQIGKRQQTGFYLAVSTTDSERVQDIYVDYFLVKTA